MNFRINKTLKVNTNCKVMQSSGNYTGFSSIGYNYNLTFQDENEIEISFAVTPKHYVIIFDGNKGILNYKHGIANGSTLFFICMIAVLVVLGLYSSYLQFKLLILVCLKFFHTTIYTYITQGLNFGNWFSISNNGLLFILVGIVLLLVMVIAVLSTYKKNGGESL